MGQLTQTTAQTQILLNDVPGKEPGNPNIQAHIHSTNNPHSTNYTPYIVSISGDSEDGGTLTATLIGTWTATGYQWQRDGVDIPGSTDNTYVVTPSDSLSVLTCKALGLESIADGLIMPEIYNPLEGLVDFTQIAGDADIVIRAAMTSSGSDEDNGMGVLVAQAGDTATFSADGMDVGAGAGWTTPELDIALATELMDSGFTLSIDVDTEFLEPSTLIAGTNLYVCGSIAGYFRRASGVLHDRFDNTNVANVAMYACSEDKPDRTNITMVCSPATIFTYIDGLLCHSQARVLNVAAQYQHWVMGGYATFTTNTDGYNIKNAVLLNRVQSFPASHIKVGLLGTSFYADAGPGAYFDDVDNDVSWYPGNGYASDGVTPVVGPTGYATTQTSRMDTGAVCQIFRQLSKAGHWTTSNSNRSQSGGLIQDAITQFDNMLTVDLVSPDIVYINLGTNEANAGTPMSAVQFDTDYKELLTDLNNASVTKVVLQEILSLENSPGLSDQLHRDTVDGYNAIINALPAWATSNTSITVVVDPIFADFGGHTPDTTLFQSGNLHPNTKGSSKLGVSAGALAVQLLA